MVKTCNNRLDVVYRVTFAHKTNHTLCNNESTKYLQVTARKIQSHLINSYSVIHMGINPQLIILSSTHYPLLLSVT